MFVGYPGTISWFQATWITNPDKITWGAVGVIIGFTIIFTLAFRQMCSDPGPVGLFMAATALVLTMLSIPTVLILTHVSDDDIYQTKQAKIVKVVHVKGSQNYLAYDQHGKRYNVDQDHTDIYTNQKASAKLVYNQPKPSISKAVFDNYDFGTLKDDQMLEINITPHTKHAKTEVWHFE